MNRISVVLLLTLLLSAAPLRADEPQNAPVDETTDTPRANEESEEESVIEGEIEEFNTTTRLEETVITATRGPRPAFDVPRETTVVDRYIIDQYSPIQAIDVLTKRDAGIIMDIRTTTTGDPVMRGFAGFNILTLIDGNTLSTLWGEGGFGADDMYGKINPDWVDHIEVVHGPYSFLYGSNALGGVINFISRRSPIPYTEADFHGGGRLALTYMSNNKGFRGRAEGFGATPELQFLVGVSYGGYGDGRGGGDVGSLSPTGGRELGFDIAADWLMAPGHELSLTVQQIHRENIGRYYRPTQDNENERLGLSLEWSAEEITSWMSPFSFRIYYQKKRDERRFNLGGPGEKHGYTETRTYAADLQASAPLEGRHLLTYGLHASVDDGESPDDEQFTIDHPRPERADAPDSLWANYAAFVQDEWDLLPKALALTAAVRYDYFVFNSMETAAYQPGNGRKADFFRDTTGAFTGGLGLTWSVAEEWRVLGSWSRGFRQFAPNFGIRQLGNGVLVPNQLLDPVTSNNYEVGVRTRYPWLAAEAFTYYSDIQDWQALRPDTWNGSDWIDFNENGVRDANEDVISQQSKEDAYVYGVEAKATLFLPEVADCIPDGWSLWGAFAWNQGKVSDGEWFRHTQPARGLIGLRWDDANPKREAFFEFTTEIVDSYDKIPSDRSKNDLAYRRDPQDGGSPLLRSYGGVPGYTIFSIYGGMNLTDDARLTLAIENLTNKKYRRAHSRMDAFGINFIATLEIVF